MSSNLKNTLNRSFQFESCFTPANGFVVAIAMTILGLAGQSTASVYNFLTCTSTGTSTSQFQSVNGNGNGVINVTDAFSSGGAGGADNVNTAIFPSSFPVLFPGTGQVQGHLAQTIYNHTSTVTFDLTGYTLSASTMFGIWNITDEVSPPVGGNAVYNLQLMDAGNNLVSPTTFILDGNEDDIGQVAGHTQLLMNTATGDLSFGSVINNAGTHTDAAFWYNIPTTTKEIIVTGNLPPLNNIGDGVGYYFAEVAVPEPSSITLLSGLSVMLLRRGKRNMA
jgi:hypothetical protein